MHRQFPAGAHSPASSYTNFVLGLTSSASGLDYCEFVLLTSTFREFLYKSFHTLTGRHHGKSKNHGFQQFYGSSRQRCEQSGTGRALGGGRSGKQSQARDQPVRRLRAFVRRQGCRGGGSRGGLAG